MKKHLIKATALLLAASILLVSSVINTVAAGQYDVIKWPVSRNRLLSD